MGDEYIEREVLGDRRENRHVLGGTSHLEETKENLEGSALCGKV